MTSEEWYLIFTLLGSWTLSISAVVGIIIEHYGRKKQFEQMAEIINTYQSSTEDFKASVESYEETLKKAPRTKVDAKTRAKVEEERTRREEEKTRREEARLEKERIKQGAAALNTLGKIFGKKR
jgi:hypothetical protein